MNRVQPDAAAFAVSLVEGRRIDVRRLIFACDDAGLLRDTLDLLEDQDGDEMLRSWLTLRLRVVEMIRHTDQVAVGAAMPMERHRGRLRPRRVPAVQTTLALAAVPPAPDPVDPLDVTGTPDAGALVLVDIAPDVDLGTLDHAEPVQVEAPPVLVDPRPAVWVPVPARRDPPPFVTACLDLLPVLFWMLRRWDAAAAGVRLHRRDLARLAQQPEHQTAARWALAHWHRTAWAEGSPFETMAAALGLDVRFEGRTLTLSDARPPTS